MDGREHQRLIDALLVEYGEARLGVVAAREDVVPGEVALRVHPAWNAGLGRPRSRAAAAHVPLDREAALSSRGVHLQHPVPVLGPRVLGPHDLGLADVTIAIDHDLGTVRHAGTSARNPSPRPFPVVLG